MTNSNLDILLNTCLDFAQNSLQKHGEFFPFGASINLAEEVSVNAGLTGEEIPDSQEIINLLEESFRQSAQANEIIACVICSDVRLKDSDAIKCDLEQKDDDSVTVFVPYKIVDGQYKYDDLIAQSLDSVIF